MGRVLVVDSSTFVQDRAGEALAGDGHEVERVQSGSEVRTALVRQAFDVVVQELRLPDMDGIALLRNLRMDPTTRNLPVIVLTDDASRSRVLQAVRYKIAGFLLKSEFDPDRLVKLIGASAGAGGVPGSDAAPGRPQSPSPPKDPREALAELKPMMTRSELTGRLSEYEQLKGFSPSVMKIIKVTSNPNCSLDQVVKPISHDQAIAVKILRLANSNLYDRGNRVDSVQKAVLRIGLEKMRQAVINLAVVDNFGHSLVTEHLNFAHFWEHSIGCGIIAAELAESAGVMDRDAAFTIGLLHDIGRVVLAETAGDEYPRVLETARRLKLPLEAVEARMLLLNHADITLTLMRSWGMPEELIRPIAFHHLSAGNLRRQTNKQLAECAVLALANRLTHALLIGNSGNPSVYATDEYTQLLKLDPKALTAVEESAVEEASNLKFSLLSLSPDVEWPDWRQEIVERLPHPFNPLYVTMAEAPDGFGMLCRRLSQDCADEPPGLAILHLANPRQAGELAGRLESEEKSLGVGRLPVMVIGAGLSAGLPRGFMSDRRHLVLPAPFVLDRFIETIVSLDAGSQSAAAA